MKTIFTVIATVAVALICFLSPTTSSAQNPDICKPDCEGSDFGPTQTTVVQLDNGCAARVKFAQRIACGTWNDVGIVSVELIQPCASLPQDPKTILDLVSVAMAKENPMGFPEPDSGKCVLSWRVVKGACWTTETDCDGDSVYVPCDSVACCLAPMEVCKDLDGNVTVTIFEGIITEPCDSTLLWCTPVCGESSSSSSGNPDLGINSGYHHRESHSQGDPFRKESPSEPEEGVATGMLPGESR